MNKCLWTLMQKFSSKHILVWEICTNTCNVMSFFCYLQKYMFFLCYKMAFASMFFIIKYYTTMYLKSYIYCNLFRKYYNTSNVWRALPGSYCDCEFPAISLVYPKKSLMDFCRCHLKLTRYNNLIYVQIVTLIWQSVYRYMYMYFLYR